MDSDELDTLQMLVSKHAEEIGIVRVILDHLEKALFGNGQPGAISTLTNRVTLLEKRYWIAIGILGTLQFLTGNGIISLKSFLGK